MLNLLDNPSKINNIANAINIMNSYSINITNVIIQNYTSDSGGALYFYSGSST